MRGIYFWEEIKLGGGIFIGGRGVKGDEKSFGWWWDYRDHPVEKITAFKKIVSLQLLLQTFK